MLSFKSQALNSWQNLIICRLIAHDMSAQYSQITYTQHKHIHILLDLPCKTEYASSIAFNACIIKYTPYEIINEIPKITFNLHSNT